MVYISIAIFALLAALAQLYSSSAHQIILSSKQNGAKESDARAAASISLDTKWTVLGPFPAGMRESHMGAFPPLGYQSLRSVMSKNKSRADVNYSSLVKGAETSVKVFDAVDVESSIHISSDSSVRRAAQDLKISYPEADWQGIRGTVGWAGVQWQALCISKLTIRGDSTANFRAVTLAAASFAIVSKSRFDDDAYADDIEWFNGDWYSYNDGETSREANSAHIFTLAPGEYYVIIKAVHEIRIHGAGDVITGPEIELKFIIDGMADGKNLRDQIVPVTSAHNVIVPDIVDGIFAGWGVGFALQNSGKKVATIVNVTLHGDTAGLLRVADNFESIAIGVGQTRPVKVQLVQEDDLPKAYNQIELGVYIESYGESETVLVTLPIEHVEMPKERPCGEQTASSFTFAYLDIDKTLQVAAAIPPLKLWKSPGDERLNTPMTLYIHGAGVDIRNRDSQQVLDRQCESWIIAPSGRTTWGTDWQGLSHDSIDAAAEAFKLHMYGIRKSDLGRVRTPSTERFMLVGHSNGGQGVYFYATHWPDKVIGAVIGAGYLRVADYVPFTWQRGRHFIEGSLEGILRSSLHPYENSLFASSLAGIPMLIKHGGADTNVPTWHSREMTGLVADWNRYSDVEKPDILSYTEIPGKPHMWPSMFKEDDVRDAIDARVTEKRNPGYSAPEQLASFTFAVANPAESGSKQGWSIVRLSIPGRIGRISVRYIAGSDSVVRVRTNNVDLLTVDTEALRKLNIPVVRMLVDGQDEVGVDLSTISSGFLRLARNKLKKWELQGDSEDDRKSSLAPQDRSLGPVIRFLQSYGGPVQIVVPRARCSKATTAHYLSIATRFSHDIYLYNRIDSVILFDDEVRVNAISHKAAQPLVKLDKGNILLLGGPNVNVVSYFSASKQGVFKFDEDTPDFSVKSAQYSQGHALIALMPDPLDATRSVRDQKTDANLQIDDPRRMTLMIHGTTWGAIEHAASLLPLRTASMLPEWAVIEASTIDGLAAQWKGYGSIVAAGWYSYDWAWSDFMGYAY